MICYLYPEPAYLIYVPDLSLIYYSHLPVTALAVFAAFFIYVNGRGFLLNRLLAVVLASFALWNVINLISWTNIHSDVILFAWSFFGICAAFISIFSIYFIHVFLDGKDVRPRLKAVFLALLAPVVLLAPTAQNLTGFNITVCDAFGFESLAYETYLAFLGGTAILWIGILLARRYRSAVPEARKQILLMGIGIELFLASFFAATYLATYFANTGILPDSQLEMYGLFGMVIFMVYIGILMVRFKTFHVNLIASQALVVALLVLIGSQLTFVRSTTNIVLTLITLSLTAVAGVVLIRSVKRETEQRLHIEDLARELEKSNKQQVALIHFITHQLKGFMAKSRMIFSMALEGDFGPVPESMRPMMEEGLKSSTKGAQTIADILNAANIQSGKVTMAKESFEFTKLLEGIIALLKPNADAKGVALTLTAPEIPVSYVGDRMQMENALKNLIDNSIKYTPKGKIDIVLAKEANLLRLTITDTGVGITPEDMQHLFTEGGHGAESRKVNVESTGFGLYIVKNIIEAHKGRVWAESEGAGKGAKFTVELPIASV